METVHNGPLIKRLNDSLKKRSNNSLRGSDLTMVQLLVLLELQQSDGQQLSMKALERRFGVAQSTIAGIIARLEQKKFVSSSGDPADRRVKLVSLTELGRACCAESADEMELAEQDIVRGFSEEEKSLFNDLLIRAVENVK